MRQSQRLVTYRHSGSVDARLPKTFLAPSPTSFVTRPRQRTDAVMASSSVSLAIHSSRRHCSITGLSSSPPKHSTTRVSHQLHADSALMYLDRVVEEAADDNDGDGADLGLEDEDVKTYEVTDEEAARLDRLFGRKVLQKSLLTEKEKRVFTRMIYDRFYRDESPTLNDPAMLYQASLEIQWLEEWIDDRRSAKDPQVESDEAARRQLKLAVLERVDFEKPLSYIIGTQPFFGCTIAVQPPLLCPRPETEMWTHWLVHNYLDRTVPRQNKKTGGETKQKGAVEKLASLISSPSSTSVSSRTGETDAATAQSISVLDMCCGTGCIGVAIARHVPTARVTAVDILPLAVDVSKRNAASNGVLPERFTAIESDLFNCFCRPEALAELTRLREDDERRRRAQMDDTAAQSRKGHSDGGHDSTTNDTMRNESNSPAFGAEVPAPSSTYSSSSSPTPTGPPPFVRSTPPSALKPEFVGAFDVIVSNPPYVFPEQYVLLPRTIVRWESKLALVGDDNRERNQYLYFKELCEVGAHLLKRRDQRHPALRDAPNIAIEIGLQGEMVAQLMEKSGLWDDVEIHLDYAQQQRWITARSIL